MKAILFVTTVLLLVAVSVASALKVNREREVASSWTWYMTFHGGTNHGNNWNNVHAYTTKGDEGNPPKVLDKSTLPDHVKLEELRGMSFGPDGNLYVCNARADYSQILQWNGTVNSNGQHEFLSVFVDESANGHPFQAIFGPDGHMYVSNQDTLDVVRYGGPFSGSPGKRLETVVSGLNAPRGISFGPDRLLYVVDEHVLDNSGKHHGKIYRYDASTGSLNSTLADPDEHFDRPVHLTWNDQILYIGNSNKNNVLYYDLTESNPKVKVLVHKSESYLNNPSGLSMCPDGMLYVASRKGMQVNSYTLSSDGHSATIDKEFIHTKLQEDFPEFLLLVHEYNDQDGKRIKKMN